MLKDTEKKLEKAYLKYCEEIYKIALSEFERVIKPFLKKEHYDFLSGNNDYYVINHKLEYTTTIQNWDLPEAIKKSLAIEVYGVFSANQLGCFMPNYNWKDENEKK